MSRPRRDTRRVDGLLLLDKPEGLTSNAALQRVRRAFRAAKAGHTGSLDPMATGVLPICLGEATKLSAYLLDSDKAYVATVRLGARTDTGDRDGTVVATSDPSTMQSDALEAVLPQFVGAQLQRPPMYSALKRDGMPLYELARQGIEVAREARPITVHALQLLSTHADGFTFSVRCAKGTYVRTLAEDWAAAAGQCGHLVALRRTALGDFDESGLVSLAALEAAEEGTRQIWLQPPARAVRDWPRVDVDPEVAQRLARGQGVTLADSRHGRVAVHGAGGVLLGLGELDGAGGLAPRRWLLPP